MDVAVQAAMILFFGVAILLVIGAPISVSVGIASVLAMFSILEADNALLTSAQRMFTGMNSFALLAIPFFVL
ncbi:hypothetical protein T458_27240 [Brevibacillus panacihumi W25]|uniref:TRAP C4-dicarboxylate transport system permease DctM subunit domain-containing protein n=1 Tax=Brevibacillus panacihumi W25 TaxID=1408254 RepID=V6M1K9_9BACL|nr:TRAP transporter large permease subunit [Brevibacillus panacihumi]EST52232.1 hypothetical protein T458_27240 [Brevibacillus panacihumi W25]